MWVKVPREEAIFQRKRPSEAARAGFAKANEGEVRRVPSLIPGPCRDDVPVGRVPLVVVPFLFEVVRLRPFPASACPSEPVR
jgi:hypothetical protein